MGGVRSWAGATAQPPKPAQKGDEAETARGDLLRADRDQIAQFVRCLFLHAGEGGIVSLRTFYDDALARKRNDPPYKIRNFKLNGGGLDLLIAAAEKLATEAANACRPVVFAPPIVTLRASKADEKNLLEGLALSVELDERTAEGLATLRAILGPPTLVVASGGTWTQPGTGEIQDRAHAHWRLNEPAVTPDEHRRLKQARTLACELVGADGTAKPIVHPMRWPGSWHRKYPDLPRLARIVEHSPASEISLEDALGEFEGLAILRAEGCKGASSPAGNDPRANDDLLHACAEVLTNPLPPKTPGQKPRGDWANWNRIGMAFWRASGGSEAGFAAFDAFSRKSPKYDAATTRARWEHYASSPPTSIGAGTLIHEARRTDRWFRVHQHRPKAERQATSGAEAEETSETIADPRPLIRLRGGGLDRSAEAAARVLAAKTLEDPFNGVYRRGNLLVRPALICSGTELERHGVKRSRGALTILPVDVDYLVLALTRFARWERHDKRSEAWVRVDAPRPVAKAVVAAADQLGQIPVLAGIIEAPTIRPDGTVLDRPGYDSATCLLFDPGGVAFPPIPAGPTREEARQALAVLRAPLAEFPFIDQASEGVVLSEIMTALIRKTMRAAPLHVVTAPKMASGKTLLATLGGYVATGRAPAMMSQADDPESERKRLLALLIEGAPLVVIDNVERPLKSDALCSILTEPLFTDRLLGASRTATAPTQALFAATGNNMAIAGDLSARAIVATLDPVCERPEERRFKVDLHQWVPEHRGELVAAALTIVRAYLAVGAPLVGKLPNFARFEDWSRLVREPLVWLGMEDPCQTRGLIEERDPVRARLTALLGAWRGVFGEAPATVAQAVAAAGETVTGADFAPAEHRHPALHEVITAVAEDRGRINRNRLGTFIAAHAGRIEAGMRFDRAGSRQGVALWAVGLVGFVGRSDPNTGNRQTQCARAEETRIDSSADLGGSDPRDPPNPPAEADEPEEIEL